MRRFAEFLVKTQEPDGYIGTYARGCRFTDDEAYRKKRTWDIWISTYLIVGLLEALGAGYISSQYKDAIAFLVIIAVLFVMPQGLFGRTGIERV